MRAGLWSNSEHEGRSAYTVVNGGGHNTRILATSQDKGAYKELGLASALWYYHRNITDSHGVEYTVKESEMPQCKVIITGDQNGDAQIDWQDGAVAFREIMNNPYKCEEVPELVAYRIAMNFGGQAQNPFLTTLDNVKRVAQHTDGLGQSVLLKGYGSEGHDSGHPDYADTGERIGGAADMKIMMEKGAEYGARFGIHVNASEMYPEAEAFGDHSVRRYTAEDEDAKKDPSLVGTLMYGWNWLDQGVGIDGYYDLGSGARKNRFNELKAKVGSLLDFVYVDVWGNLTATRTEDSWETRHLTDGITGQGWRMATEWGSGNEYDSTFQHWAADLTYGGFDKKGENSEVMRFLRNHQKDSWIGDYPSYGGNAIAPLLGGYSMKDFEGWQGRNDYDAYIKNLYTHDLTTKFLQHYKVIKWVDGEAVSDGKYNWTPEKEITLKDDYGNVVVVTRETTDHTSPAYRNRTITLNGKVVSTGAVSKGDNGKDGTESYLLPWNWDSKTGKPVSSEKEKMYHWNTLGGTTTWKLADNWKDLKTVTVYKLTDLGKTEEKTVNVVNGEITLEAEAQVPYVVYKGKTDNLSITWSEKMHLTDVGFNSGEAGIQAHWTIEGTGTATIAKSQYSNPMLKLDGEVAVSQKITDLVPGKKYALYLGVDNRSDTKVCIEVKAGNEVLDSNYTMRSIAPNYVKAYTHSNSSATVDNSSYFQNLYVFFTAPADTGNVVLKISKEAGEGSAYFDDIRVVETSMDVIKKDADGNVVSLVQDFENNVQGIYPFVVGPIEGVEDNRTHLSQAHAPYTQAEWDVKKVDDVLDGKWSLKSNGLAGGKLTTLTGKGLLYQTIPQNFRFEPGRTYKVSFDYQSGSDGTYAVTFGEGEFLGKTPLEKLPKAMGRDQDGHYETELVGAASGETWFGISATGTAADTQGTKNAAADFGGYKDFVLDNLKIELVKEEINKETVNALAAQAEKSYMERDYTREEWEAFQEALIHAKVEANRDKTDQKEMEEAYYALKAAINVLDQSAGAAEEDYFDITPEHYTATAGSEQAGTGKEGPVNYAIDGDASTHWMTDKTVNALQDGVAWINIHFDRPQTIDGVRYLPKAGGSKDGKLLEAEIQVNRGARSYETIVADALFEEDTKWQRILFDEVEGVTDIRIIPRKTAATLKKNQDKYAAIAELRVLYSAPRAVTAEKEGLKAAIDEVAGLREEAYTAAFWKYFQEKLRIAQSVLANEDATEYEVALALVNLKDAAADLVVKVPLHIEALQNAVNLAAQVSTEGVKDPAAVERFQKVLQEARDMLVRVKAQDESVTQEMVDQCCEELLAAVGALEYGKGDKTELAKLVQAAGQLDLSKYQEEGKDAFKAALETAKAVVEKENATQEEINAAWNNLLTAMNNLRLLPGQEQEPDQSDRTPDQNGEKPDQNEQKPGQNKTPEGSKVQKNVRTGDTINLVLPVCIGMMAFALLVMAAILKKRRRW